MSFGEPVINKTSIETDVNSITLRKHVSVLTFALLYRNPS